MLENKLNEIVGSSLSWHFKPQDGRYLKSPICFDGFGIFKPFEAPAIPVYWESKNLKKPQAFNFNDLKPHQIGNLLRIQDLMPTALCLFLVCVDYGRMQKRVFIFRDMQYVAKRKDEKRSILKKEFDKRRNYVLIKKDHISFEDVLALPREWEYEE